MLFHCRRVQANFPAEKLGLVSREKTGLRWDEHGGTFVLRVEGLELVEAPEAGGEAGIRVEIDLPEPASLADQIESFAGKHSLRLGQGRGGGEVEEKAVLAAVHLPGQRLFVYGEDPRLTVRRSGRQGLELLVQGAFKARQVPCQETDLVIHLERGPMCQVLAEMLGWAQAGG